MLYDIEIAQQAKMLKITEVAAKLEAFAKTLGKFYPVITEHNDKE